MMLKNIVSRNGITVTFKNLFVIPQSTSISFGTRPFSSSNDSGSSGSSGGSDNKHYFRLPKDASNTTATTSPYPSSSTSAKIEDVVQQNQFIHYIPQAGVITNATAASLSESHDPNKYTSTHHSVLNLSLDQLINMYNTRRHIDLSHVPTLDSQDVFINSELKLSEIKAYGFDYDFTLANYSDQVQHLIYDLSLKYLVEECKYPANLLKLKYDQNFAIRGLHYDMRTGLLMKLDFLNNIQAGAIYYGRRSLTKEEIVTIYGSMQLRKAYCETYLKIMADIFCLPESCLISDITQFLIDNNYQFEPRIIYDDIIKAVKMVHMSGSLHNTIISDLPLYLNKHPLLGDYLLKLKNAGKKLFMLTNNSFYYANCGMKYLLNDQLQGQYTDWTELFDVIITQCDKPSFFGKGRHFRMYDRKSDRYDWREIKEFLPGKVYVGGSLGQFTHLSKWRGRSVMYFGDHLFADLVEPSMIEGWRTGVIIKELETEVEIQNSPKYRENLSQLLEIEEAIRRCQFFTGEKKDAFLESLKQKRYALRLQLKEPFNGSFGSLFRTHTNATMLAHSLQNHADIYTSKIENLITYPLDYTFYTRRNYLAHEFKLN
ncbi:5'-nucleotidase [Cavenderia fasciculata]|uniref:5'-nucleotidase n=1 Tax=Cavenderia fasciculata TaxID=261658 RepID=F4PKE6_CACFS|nr:5'-nucleotidase [Cavenderia fasciculata]EGG24070.1 5'-nucleotidase [Cavenderia fasciculata]|eukprot:XP_004361921.1 5'-nucleotidase [Cavenderia fasciculata]